MSYYIVKTDTDGLTYFMSDWSMTDKKWILEIGRAFRYFDKGAAERKSKLIKDSRVVDSAEAGEIDQRNEDNIVEDTDT